MNTLFRYINIFLVLFLSGYVACHQQQSDSVSVDKEIELPDQELWDLDLTATKKGNVEAKIKAGHGSRFLKKAIVKMDQGVVVDFYDADGKHKSKLTAERGELDEKSNDVRAMDNVVVVSDSGLTLFTEELAYDQRMGKIISNVDVMITTTESDTFYGVGFESEPDLSAWQMFDFSGKTHKGLDLSTDRFKKDKKKDIDSLDVNTPPSDSLTVSKEE